MLALVVARPSTVRDGLVALLEASPEIDKIMQVEKAGTALDVVRTIQPNITLLYNTALTSDLLALVAELKRVCSCPLVAVVGSEEDRKAAVSHGADIAVLEGLPSSRLETEIARLIQQQLVSKTENQELSA